MAKAKALSSRKSKPSCYFLLHWLRGGGLKEGDQQATRSKATDEKLTASQSSVWAGPTTSSAKMTSRGMTTKLYPLSLWSARSKRKRGRTQTTKADGQVGTKTPHSDDQVRPGLLAATAPNRHGEPAMQLLRAGNLR